MLCRYNGFQVQNHTCRKVATVQHRVEEAVCQISQQSPSSLRMQSAGRTDTGVHARGQVSCSQHCMGSCDCLLQQHSPERCQHACQRQGTTAAARATFTGASPMHRAEQVTQSLCRPCGNVVAALAFSVTFPTEFAATVPQSCRQSTFTSSSRLMTATQYASS